MVPTKRSASLRPAARPDWVFAGKVFRFCRFCRLRPGHTPGIPQPTSHSVGPRTLSRRYFPDAPQGHFPSVGQRSQPPDRLRDLSCGRTSKVSASGEWYRAVDFPDRFDRFGWLAGRGFRCRVGRGDHPSHQSAALRPLVSQSHQVRVPGRSADRRGSEPAFSRLVAKNLRRGRARRGQ